jgi:AcrR family transcriptional regulator
VCVPDAKISRFWSRACSSRAIPLPAYICPTTERSSLIFAGVADTAVQRPGGRTARVREAALRATLQELLEHGYLGASLDTIARRSGVNKATLYRRWGGRDGLILDAVEWFGVTQADVPDTGEFDADLRLWAQSIHAMLTDETTAALVRAVFAADPDATRPLRRRFWHSHLNLVRPIVERAIARNEIPANTDVDEVIRHVGAPLYYRFLVLDEAVTPEAAELAAVVAAHAARHGLFVRDPS